MRSTSGQLKKQFLISFVRRASILKGYFQVVFCTFFVTLRATITAIYIHVLGFELELQLHNVLDYTWCIISDYVK